MRRCNCAKGRRETLHVRCKGSCGSETCKSKTQEKVNQTSGSIVARKNKRGAMSQQNGKTAVTVPAGATRTELEDIKGDLERQRDERMNALISGDPSLREITGALKGISFALDGPPETDDSGN